MDESAVIDFLLKICQKEQLACSKKKSAHEVAIDLGKDAQGRARSLLIKVMRQILSPARSSKREDPRSYFHIQFSVKLPFGIQSAATSEVESLLLFINRTLELPGFEMSELDDALFYRYVWLTGENGLEEPIVLGIIGVILMTLDLLSDMIEKIASGSITFNQALEIAVGNIGGTQST